MFLLLDIILIICCLAIIYQDFKHRSIYWFWIPILLVSLLGKLLVGQEYTFFTTDLPLNLAMLFANGLVVTIYFSLKQRRWINLMDTYIGKGDVYLFLVMALAFPFQQFIIFFIASLLLSLMVYSFQMTLKISSQPTIPLAAYICILFTVILIGEYIPGMSDDLIFSYWNLK